MEAGVRHIIPSEGCALHAWVYGRNDAPAVVLSHGATLDHDSWAPQIEALAQHYRVITWDMRGHGLSQPLTGKFTFRRGAADLIAILDHLGIDRAALVGLSMGGFVSQQVAYDWPHRVAAIASFDAGSITAFKMGAFARFGLAASSWIMRLYPRRWLVEAIARGSSIRPDVQDYIRRTAGALSKGAIIDIWSGVQTGLRWEPGYRVRQPLLIGVGEHDRIGYTARANREWAAIEPAAAFHVIPDAGHCANQDNPAAVNAVLLDFLGRYCRDGDRPIRSAISDDTKT